MFPASLAPEDPVVLEPSHAILVVLEVALLGAVEALQHTHPELAEEPPRPVSAMSSPHDRLAHLVISQADALLAALRSYRALAADESDF